jgi:hypothetical protein
MSKGLWLDVYFGLNEDNTHFKKYVVDEYCQSLPRDYKVYQLPCVCARVRAWLYSDGGRETVTRAVEEASRTAEDSYFARYMLPHCKNQQVISVLNNLVSRRMWQSVSDLLEKRDRYKVLSEQEWEGHFQWAVKEAARTASDEDIIEYIAKLCGPEQKVKLLLPWMIDFEKWTAVRDVVHTAVYEAISDLTSTFHDSDTESTFHASDTDDMKHVEHFWLMMTMLKVHPVHHSTAILAKN